jgi:hypothetical protein
VPHSFEDRKEEAFMPKRGAAHWLGRAEEARLLAEQTGDEDARRELLRMAASYEKRATLAVERAAAELVSAPCSGLYG